MLRSDWLKVFAISGLAILTPIFWFDFSPRPPDLPTYKASQGPERDYRAGGSRCSPEALARLGGAEALAEKDRCAEAAEEHRLKSDDLVQQTRAADAARAGAILGYDVAMMTLVGVLLGLFTVIAAGLAAYYARRAYLEAEKSLKHQERATRLQLQPFLYWKSTSCEAEQLADGKCFVEIRIDVQNAGQTPALNVRWNAQMCIRDAGDRTVRPILGEPDGSLIIPPQSSRQSVFGIVIPQSYWDDVLNYKKDICVASHIIFDSRWAKGKTLIEYRCSRGNAIAQGMFFYDEEISDVVQPSFDFDAPNDSGQGEPDG